MDINKGPIISVDEMKEILGTQRPKVVFKDVSLIKNKVKKVIANEIINRDTDGKPMRVTIRIITTTVRETVIREFDPEHNYEDSIDVFKGN